jgi:hypothetical protein
MNPVGLPNKADLLRTEVRAAMNAKQQAIFGNSEPEMAKWDRLLFRGRPIWPSLDPIAGLPDVQNIGGDHANHDQHPVLDLEAQKGEMLDQKLHRSSPLFGQDKRFGRRTILFLYFQSGPAGASATVVATKIPHVHGGERSAGPSESSLSNSEGS